MDTRIKWLLVPVLLSGCGKDHWLDCLKGTGKEVTVTREIAPFHAVDLQDNVALEFHSGYKPWVEVTCGNNVAGGIVTRSVDGTLFISNENKCNWARDFNRKITVRIHCDSLTLLTDRSAGDVTFADTLSCSSFTLDNKSSTGDLRLLVHLGSFYCNTSGGSSDIEISGQAGSSEIFHNAVGNARLQALATGTVYVNNSGTGDLFLKVQNELYARIEDRGNIYYHGEPWKVEETITGTGRLIKVE